MTPSRAFVLDTLLESHRALTAYQLLDRLREADLGKEPPVVYRALDFLTTHGFVHRIEQLSAYVACTRGEEPHAMAFLICGDCRRVDEVPVDLARSRLGEGACAAGFAVDRVSIEVEGRCAACGSVPATGAGQTTREYRADACRGFPAGRAADGARLGAGRRRVATRRRCRGNPMRGARDFLLAGAGLRLGIVAAVLALLWLGYAAVTG